MKKLLSYFFLLLLIIPEYSAAWGARGHDLIAEVAFHYLDSETRSHVQQILGGMTIQQAANWMDEVRSDPQYDFMKTYHYADFEKGVPASEQNGANVIGVLEKTLGELDQIHQMNTAEIKIRLLYLMHLVGDIHQPLHVGYPEDKGGNLYQVSFLERGTNLHRVWDSGIIDFENISLEEVLDAVPLSPQKIHSIQHIDIVAWANESRGYLPMVYGLQGHKIGQTYVRQATVIIKKQLLYAGLRLAGILEHYFKNAPVPSSAYASQPALTSDSRVPSIQVDEAGNFVGKRVRVCAKVYGTKFLISSGRKPTFLDLGAPYPNAPLTIVIWGEVRGQFSEAPEVYYQGKTICVTGEIILYRGKPEIIVSDPKQILTQ